MSKLTNPDFFADAIDGLLNRYGKSVREGTYQLIEKYGQQALKEIKAASPVYTGKSTGKYKKRKAGKYKRGWRLDINMNALGTKKATIHNKTDYQLTHLTEKGHLNRDGTSRSKAIPHIKPVDERISTEFPDAIKDMIEIVGRDL